AEMGSIESSSLLKKVFEVSLWATLIQDPSARRTKDSQPSGFGFEYCASNVRFRVFQQTARPRIPGSFGRRPGKEAEMDVKVVASRYSDRPKTDPAKTHLPDRRSRRRR